MDIIPVNYVADAIYKSAKEKAWTGDVWHLCSGQEGVWSLDELVSVIREMLEARNQALPKLRLVERSAFREKLVN